MINWDWDALHRSLPDFLGGIGVTLQLVFISLIAGLVLAVLLALMRTSTKAWLRALPIGYIFFFRGTPLLVQIFLVYAGLSQFEFIRNSFLGPVLNQAYWCAIIAFTLNTGAYSAELIRGAIQGIPKGELEAADAFGMTKFTKIRRIILPRAFGIVFPAYGNEIILMLKGSALASTITLMDVMGVAITWGSDYYLQTEFYCAAGVIYLLISAVFILVFRLIERWLNRYLYYQAPEVVPTDLAQID